MNLRKAPIYSSNLGDLGQEMKITDPNLGNDRSLMVEDEDEEGEEYDKADAEEFVESQDKGFHEFRVRLSKNDDDEKVFEEFNVMKGGIKQNRSPTALQ
mmetsp:Transcript_27975/g.24659  ORF Transcript_27975/g.24659 Transcript_27975/m.24659 type:complete len:99 (-) Transcript_27975:3406-3702(-)